MIVVNPKPTANFKLALSCIDEHVEVQSTIPTDYNGVIVAFDTAIKKLTGQTKQGVYDNVFAVTTDNPVRITYTLARAMHYKPAKYWEYIQDFDQLMWVVDKCKETGYFFFDYETTGLDFKKDVPTMLGMSFQAGYTYILPLIHKESWCKQGDVEVIFSILGEEIFGNRDVIKVAQNITFEYLFTSQWTELWKGECHDTKVMHHHLDENQSNKLKDMTYKYLPSLGGYELDIKKHQWANAPLDVLAPYCARDVDVTARLFSYFQGELLKDLAVYRQYRNIMMAGMSSLADATKFGQYIDKEVLEIASRKAVSMMERRYAKLLNYSEVTQYEAITRERIKKETIRELEDKIAKLYLKYSKHKYIDNYYERIRQIKSGEVVPYEGINLHSPKQLGELLYTVEGFAFDQSYDHKKEEYTMTTNRKYLQTLDHPFIDDLIALRQLKKINSTYYLPIIEKADENSFIHGNFNLTGTVTFRLSANNPNLQNIPRITDHVDEEVKWCNNQIKKAFITPKGYTMVQADFSQAELRTIANFSQDENMIRAYKDGIDIHSLTGARIAGMPFEDFIESTQFKAFRQIAKSANFGMVYEISPKGYIEYVYNQTGNVLSEEEEEIHRDAIFGLYIKLKEWHATYKKKVRKFGYVRNFFGGKRHLPDITSDDYVKASAAERYAINSPIQGTIGLYTVFCIALLDLILPEEVVFFNTVHDSVFYYVPNELLHDVIDAIRSVCEDPDIKYWFKKDWGAVPLKMDFTVGERWADLKDYEIE